MRHCLLKVAGAREGRSGGGQMSVTIRFRYHSFCYNMPVFLAKQQWGRFGGIYSGVLRAPPRSGGEKATFGGVLIRICAAPDFLPEIVWGDLGGNIY